MVMYKIKRAEKWQGASTKVISYTISGKGHSWPGSSMPERITTKDIDTTKEIWIFFKQHSSPDK